MLLNSFVKKLVLYAINAVHHKELPHATGVCFTGYFRNEKLKPQIFSDY